MREKRTFVHIAIMPISDWTILPWYSSGWCKNRCCFTRMFTWVFLAVRLITVYKPNKEMP